MSLKEIIYDAYINKTDIVLDTYDLLEQLTPELVIIIGNISNRITGKSGERIKLIKVGKTEHQLYLHSRVRNIPEIISIAKMICNSNNDTLVQYSEYHGDSICEFIQAAEKLNLYHTNLTQEIIEYLHSHCLPPIESTDTIVKNYFTSK